MKSGPLALAFVLLMAASVPVEGVRAEDPPPAGGAPPPAPAVDNRFFPKEMEDRLAEMIAGPDPEERYDALNGLRRMVGLDGAKEPLSDRTWSEVLQRAVGADHESMTALAGEYLAALDGDRLAKELKAAAKSERRPSRVADLATLALALGAPRGVELLIGPVADAASSPEALARVVDALGVLRAKEGVPMALNALRHQEPSVRNAAAVALGRMGDTKAVPQLLAGLSDSKGYHGWYCAEALGMLEGDDVFSQVVARSTGGGAEGPRAKAIEMAARKRHLAELVQMVQKGGSRDVRAGAANALARLGSAGGGAGGDGTSSGSDALTPKERADAADALLETMVSDGDPDVRGAAFWALRFCAGPDTAAKAADRFGVKGDDKLIYLVTILGDLRYAPVAPLLLRAMFQDKRIMVRRASAIAFWQISDEESIAEFEKRMMASTDRGVFSRGCEALGSWRSDRAFRLALQLMEKNRTRGNNLFAVELCLEKMTGHFFGPDESIWKQWFEKNPKYFTPKQASIEREKWREDFDKENKGFRQTKDTEKSVQMGLRWLARHQGLDGVVDAVDFARRCGTEDGKACDKVAGARTQIAQSGTSGLSMLAFTGAGYSPEGGKYAATLRRGLDHLSATMNVFGDYDQPDLLFNRGYARPVALQALAEGYALGRDERMRWAAERVLARQFALMNDNGGWRYALMRNSPEVDSSVTAWVLFAVKTSEKSGIKVPRLFYEGCYLAFDHLSERVPPDGPREQWVDIDPEYGFEVGRDATYLFQTGYQDDSGAASRATTPLGLMSRIFLGWRRSHPFCIGSANYINKYYLTDFDIFGEPGKEDWSKVGRFTPRGQWVMYSYYYCTVALHQMGGRFFRDWNRRIGRILPQFQLKDGCDRGAFAGWNTDRVYGRVYSTAMGVLTLETYYRYAPVLQD